MALCPKTRSFWTRAVLVCALGALWGCAGSPEQSLLKGPNIRQSAELPCTVSSLEDGIHFTLSVELPSADLGSSVDMHLEAAPDFGEVTLPFMLQPGNLNWEVDLALSSERIMIGDALDASSRFTAVTIELELVNGADTTFLCAMTFAPLVPAPIQP